MTEPFAEGFLLHDLGRQYQGVAREVLAGPQPLPARLAQLAQQVKAFFIDLTEDGGQSFSNHFARMSYVAQAAQADPKLTYFLHQFDREASRHLRGKPDVRLTPDQALLLGAKALVDAIAAILKLACPPDLAEVLPADYEAFRLQRYTVAEYKPQLRALVLENLEARQVLRVRLVDAPGLDHYVHYGREGYNAEFVAPAVRLIERHFALPLEVNLIGVEVDADGELNPQHLIIEPDFLVDITSVSKCFDASGPEPVKYLLGRVTPFSSSVALMAGNVANHFLDTAVTGQRKPFRESFVETFAQAPLQYARLGDEEVRALYEKCAGHYGVIGDCVERHFPDQAIDAERVSVEPSFYSERYGLQGRLDLFLPPAGDQDAAIVELKSGKIYRPNQHRVNQEHYVQTLLYDLLVRSVYSDRARPRNFVLYSGEKDEPLRYAPPNRAQQYQALAVRNQMMAIERLLAASRPGAPCPLDWLRPERYPNLSGFVRRDIEAFHAAYARLAPVEKDYLRAFVGFVAREQRLAKVGVHGGERITGQAALWREDLDTKLDGYAILHDLALVTVAQKDGFPVLSFRRAGAGGAHALTSFRRGDIVVLYAGDARRRAVLRHQVYKGTLLEVTDALVRVRLRASQPDLTHFQRASAWNVEGDLFDSSFTGLYRNLAAFAASPTAARERVLGLRAPERPPAPAPVRPPAAMTAEQGRIFAEILAARDYYLLWGPPGTGKTSVMLHHLCAHLADRTRERVLVLAYTNRAVDEICRAVSRIGGGIEDRYLRIGSSFSCAPEFAPQLLQERIRHLRRREDIRELLQRQRIVVGTVSSVLGKAESLFELVEFDRLVIDEASQLLEPLIVSLVTRFPKTLLIGDHRQLPAVVTQPAADTRVADKALRAIGLTDMRNSLFERLYDRCQVENWDWAFGQLTRQGRMHDTLAAYANRAFYDGRLRGLEVAEASRDWQRLPNCYSPPPADCSPLDDLFCRRSFVAVDTPVDLSDQAFRTNAYEAAAVVAAIAAFIRIKRERHVELEPRHVGVITPYRAQIARIRQAVTESDLPEEWDALTVDTVERFQGASFDIVLISICANRGNLVARLSSNNDEARDRKLNVALTRARERVVLFGNQALLREHNVAYADFLDHCAECGSVYAPEPGPDDRLREPDAGAPVPTGA